jgi:hypothetical protein
LTTFLGERTHTRRRYAADTLVSGRKVAGLATDSTFLGSVQPAPEKDRQVLPEGLRSRDVRKVYCDKGTLRTEDQHAGTKADEVVVDGAVFTVAHTDDSHEEISHQKAILVRKQEGAT